MGQSARCDWMMLWITAGAAKAVANGAPLDFAGDKPSGSFSQVCQEGCGAVPLSGNVVNLPVGWAGGSCRESGTARN